MWAFNLAAVVIISIPLDVVINIVDRGHQLLVLPMKRQELMFYAQGCSTCIGLGLVFKNMVYPNLSHISKMGLPMKVSSSFSCKWIGLCSCLLVSLHYPVPSCNHVYFT